MTHTPDNSGDSPYDARAREFSDRYEAVRFEQIHEAILGLVPSKPGHVLDIGAGSGRDAAWFAYRGHEVVAVEPSAGMRHEARERHAAPNIRWLPDRLPALSLTLRLGLDFDFILLSAVWMHVAPADRRRAFRKLVTLLAPKGRLVITLRLGPADPERAMFPVSRGELEHLAHDFGLRLLHSTVSDDVLGRGDIRWETLAFGFPDDETGALPLLRHIVLRDDKSSTYKIALLRTLARVADSAPGFARDTSDDLVSVPLGLVALFWVRMMKPLVEHDYPQTPTNRHGRGLGFVKPPFHALRATPPVLLRPGIRFGPDGRELTAALRDAAATICQMPARYITYPGGDRPVFPTRRRTIHLPSGAISLDEAYLRSFGEFLVPSPVWRTASRLNVWIDPVLTSEWIALMQRYGRGQGRHLSHDALARALAWADPERDTRLARNRALDLLEHGYRLRCIWTGTRLSRAHLDIDHCFPFSAWPCSDLWNLLPSSRRVNQREKKGRLVSAACLEAVQPRLAQWWREAWTSRDNEAWQPQFFDEARASLPLATSPDTEPTLDDVFDGVRIRRSLLHQTQGLPEWDGR